MLPRVKQKNLVPNEEGGWHSLMEGRTSRVGKCQDVSWGCGAWHKCLTLPRLTGSGLRRCDISLQSNQGGTRGNLETIASMKDLSKPNSAKLLVSRARKRTCPFVECRSVAPFLF